MTRGQNPRGSGRQVNTPEARRQAFGAALATRRKELQLSQTALGRALGGVAQSAISQWESGETEPRAGYVYAAESALGLTPGTLSRLLGYLPPSSAGLSDPGSFREAVQRDPLLTAEEKRSFLVLYHAVTGGRSAALTDGAAGLARARYGSDPSVSRQPSPARRRGRS